MSRAWLMLALVAVCGCGGADRLRAAQALDVARVLHTEGCLDAPLLSPGTCEWAYLRLVAIEPSIEDALAGGRARRALSVLWTEAQPYVMPLVQMGLDWLKWRLAPGAA